jgi:spore maturation protein CgeB
MEALGHQVKHVYYRREGENPSLILALYRAVWRRFEYPRERCDENASLVRAVTELRPDIVWVEKGLTIRPKTLEKIRQISPQTILVAYSPDDMMNLRNTSRYYWKSLSTYDIHLTNKTYNVSELTEKGARQVNLVGTGYDPKIHRPIELSPSDYATYLSDVGFVGDYEEDRAKRMTSIAMSDFPVRIWGTRWNRLSRLHPNLKIEGRPVYGDEYAKVLCATKINLCFLRKANRDQHTTRTIEIPACGAFMLAERTKEHLKLFEEGKEAEFFETDDEMIAKIRYYLTRAEERRRIALAGRERCLKSGYSNHHRIASVLKNILELREGDGQ